MTQRVGFTGARLRISRLKPDAGLQRTLERICEISAHALGVARVGVWLAEVEEDRLRCVAQYAEGVDGPPLETLRISAYPQYCDAVLNNRFVAAIDVGSDARTKELAASFLGPLGITSMLDAALYRDGRVIGVVCHESVGTRRKWDAEERQFAATV
ncbi:MAG: GAF domain-containing protein, partial [Myxococcaceae bacterium]|nr:GAF domain-containing protein [Myxococcaceae bacterium]